MYREVDKQNQQSLREAEVFAFEQVKERSELYEREGARRSSSDEVLRACSKAVCKKSKKARRALLILFRPPPSRIAEDGEAARRQSCHPDLILKPALVAGFTFCQKESTFYYLHAQSLKDSNPV